MVKHLAACVAGDEDMLATIQATAAQAPAPVPVEVFEDYHKPAAAPAAEDKRTALPPVPTPVATAEGAPSRNQTQMLAAVRAAVDENRIDIYLQPLVTLPQRKVRYYEAMTRLRDD